MRFCCQTLLFVCLGLPLALFAQPVANADNALVNEDESVIVDIIGNDTGGADPSTVDLDPSTADEDKSLSTPDGNFVVNSSGELEFTPAPDFNGIVTIDYTVKDASALLSDPATVTITVTPVNDPPTISSISNVTIAENASTPPVPFTIADVDNDAADLEVTAVSSNSTLIPPGGIVLGGSNGNRTITLTPASGEWGTATITVTVSDGEASVDASFDIEVEEAQPPVIVVSGDVITDEDTPGGTVTVTVTDADSPSGDLTLTATSGNTVLLPDANISLVPGAPGTWTLSITPAPDQHGATTITLVASDGLNTDTESVSVTVNSVNDPTSISSIANQVIPMNGVAGPIAFTITDADGFDDLTVSVAGNNAALVAPSGLVLGGSAGNRTITVTPIADVSGSATITITVTDGVTSVDEAFLLTVTAPPVMVATNNLATDEDTPSLPVDFTVSDPDTPPASISVTAVSGNEALIPTASIQVVRVSGGNWTVAATPAPDAFGSTTITLTASDGTQTDEATISASVNAINDPPAIGLIAAQTVAEGATLGPVDFTIEDIDNDVNGFTPSGSAADATLVSTAGISFGGSGANRTFTITPEPQQSGITNVTIEVSDGELSAQRTFQLTVTEVDDPPTITPVAALTTLEDVLSGTREFTVADPDTDLSALVVTATSGNTVLIPNANITLTPGAGGLWTVQVMPAPNQSGSATVTLRVTDGTTEVTTPLVVNVTSVNDLPVISSIADQTIDENTSTDPLPFTISDIETVPGSLTLEAASTNTTLVPVASVVFGGSAGNRTVTVTPVPGQWGATTITVTVRDAHGGEAQESFVLNVLEVNDPPFFVNVTELTDRTINEDGSTGSLDFQIGDPNSPAGSLVVTGSSTNTGLVDAGGLAFGGSGANRNVTITPNLNAFGFTMITIRVSDGNLFAEHTFRLDVTSVNDLPTITSITDQTILENESTGLLGFTIGDIETSPFALTMTSLSSNPALADNTNIIFGGSGSQRNVNVIPKINRSGVATITLTVTDANGGTAQTAFLLSVTAVDAPPTISPIDDITIVEDTPSDLIDFTVADIDVPAEDLIVTGISGNTSVVANSGIALTEVSPGNWRVRITPVLNASGTSLITLTVNDGTETATETFTVTVTPFNDLPTITPIIATQNINEDGSTGTINFTVGDVETLAANLSVTASSSDPAVVAPAGIVLGGSGASRSIQVSPVLNASGFADITIRVEDTDGGERTQTFRVNVAPVNDVPTISSIANQNIDEDQDGGTGPIPFTVTDVEPGTLTVSAATSAPTLVPLSNITLSGTGTNRTVTVVPALNQFGTVTITLTVTDADASPESATTSFNVIVASVNDAPTISTPTNQTINENTSTGPIAFTVGDVETAPGSLTVTRASSNTTLFPLANVVLSGTGANRSVTATPVPSLGGTATITLSVSDGNLTTTTTFDITVINIEDPPTISPIADHSTNEDTPTSPIPFTIADPDTPIASLVVSAASDNQTIVPDANIVLSPSGASRTVTITPAPNQNGDVNIIITVSDGTNVVNESFTLTVIAVNDPPTITAIGDQTTNEDTPTGNIGFTIGDPETAATGLTVTSSSDNTALVPDDPANQVLTGTGASRMIRIVPALNASGIANITVTVSDGTESASRTFRVTVTPVDDAPTITAIADQTTAEDTNTGPIPFTIGDVDTPIGSLVITLGSSNTTLAPVANMTLGGSGANRTVSILPALNQFGSTTISITVDDGTTTAVREFELTVTPVNDPPTISAISNRTTNEDTPTGPISFTISDPDMPAGDLTLSAASDNTTLIPTANIVFGGSGGSRTVNITPALNEFGSALITITVSDGVNSVDRSFTLNVTPVNDLPVITGQEPISIAEGQPVTLDFVLLHVFDPDNTIAQLTLLPTGGANYSLTGPATITPVPAYHGPLTVPVLVSDGNGVGPLFNVAITVISTNDPPVITGQNTITMDEDQTLTLQLSDFIFHDPDVEDNNHTLVVKPGTGYTVLPGNRITPDLNFNGALTVIVAVSDGQVESAPYNGTVIVNPVNDPPTITGQTTLATDEEQAFTLLIGHFTVVDPEPTSYTLIVLPPAADAPYTASGNTITPKLNYNGMMTVPVRANDGQANSAVYDAQVMVNPVNDKPVIISHASLSTVEDIPITLKLEDLVVEDVDNPGYPAGFTMTVLPGTNYTFNQLTVIPALDYNGTIFVNVQVNDGLANSDVFQVRITVTDDDDAPSITGQHPVSMNEDTERVIVIGDLISVDADTPEADRIVHILAGTNYTFRAGATGPILVPAPNFFGTLTVNVRIFDGSAFSNTFPLQVTVINVNDPPFFNSIANVTILEDAPTQTVTITGISSGPNESDPMTLTVISDNTALIPHPVRNYTSGASSATLSFAPTANASGTATITVTFIDQAPGFTRTFTITVTPVNDPPTLTAIPNFTLDEDSPEQVHSLTGISPGGGSFEADQTIDFIVGNDNSDLFEIVPQILNDGPGGAPRLHYKPKKDAFGVANVTVRIQDSGPSSPPPNVNFLERTFTITITPVNDPPVVVSEPGRVAEPGKEYRYDLVVTDADNDDLTIVASSLPSWLSIVQGENGHATISGVPPQAAGSTISIVITITDAAGVEIPGGYDLTVNSRPVVSNITLAFNEDTEQKLAASDFDGPGFDDPDGNALAELQILTLPLHGDLRAPAGLVEAGAKFPAEQIATLIYTPHANYFGIDTLRWTAADGYYLYPLNPAGALLTFNILPVNDIPEFTMELETDTLKYELGSEAEMLLTRKFDCWDVDGDNITSASISFRTIDGYQVDEMHDVLRMSKPSPNITAEYTGTTLRFQGTARPEEYDSAIRSVVYQYVNVRELSVPMRLVSIELSDGKSQSAQHSRLIELIYTFEDLLIPAAFTPNEGDDVNKTWVITSPNGEGLYSDAEIRVYNKTGQLLFQTRGLDDPWTGIYNGTLLPTDTYYYTIDLHYNKVRYKGTVTLLR